MAGGNRVSMTEGPLLGVILRVAGPIAFASLAQSLHMIINAVFVGRLGAESIAAVAASGPLFSVLLSLGSGLSIAGAVLVAQNIGAGRTDRVDHVAAQTLLMVIAVGLCFALAGFLLAPWTLRLIGVEELVFDLSWQYLTISYLGLTPMFCFLACQAMLQSAGEVKFAMKVSVGAVLLNLALDPLLIFGIGDWDGWGVAGAAVATVVARLCAFVVVLRHMMSGASALHLERVHFIPDFSHFRIAAKLGIPAALEQGGRTFGSLLLMSLSALFGTVTLAAYGIGVQPLFFWFAPMMALSVATAAIVGQNIGAGKMGRAEEAARVSSWLSVIAFTVIGLLHLPFIRVIYELFAPEETEVVNQAVSFGWALYPYLGIMALTHVLRGVFRGAGSTQQAMWIALILQYGFQLPFAWGIALFTPYGPLGVWWSYTFSSVIGTAICLYWLKKGPWRKSLVEPATAQN